MSGHNIKYFLFLLGFRKKSELSDMQGILSKSFIETDLREKLSKQYKDYSFRLELKKIANVSIVCARVRCGKTNNETSFKHWYAYQEISGEVISWVLR